MRIACISGSRADFSTVDQVRMALLSCGHQVDFIRLNLETENVGYAAVTAMGAAVQQFERLRPELVVLAGDRFEILMAASAANFLKIPIAHVAGGDVTVGSQDDAIRHAITQLSQIHFATNKDAARRIMSMGINPHRVHTVGSPSVDRVKRTVIVPRETILEKLKVPEAFYVVLVNYQAPTLAENQEGECEEFFHALRIFESENDCSFAFCTVNIDNGASIIKSIMGSFHATRQNTVMLPNVTPESYLQLLANVDLLVGNSSSGFYEASYFGTPVVNVGDRQRGRPEWHNIATCAPIRTIIARYMTVAAVGGKFPKGGHFGNGDACANIANVVRELDLQKIFKVAA